MRHRFLWGAVVAALLGSLAGLPSCSWVATVDRMECTQASDCTGAFGFGSACIEDGFCSEMAPSHPRCTKTFPEDLLERPDKYRDAIVFGTVFNRSVEKHAARERSAELAVSEANRKSGLDGRSFGLVFCSIEERLDYDDLASGDAALDVANYLVHTLAVPALIGPAGSGDTAEVFKALRGTDTLVISPSATSPSLTALDEINPTDKNPGLLWRTAPPDTYQGIEIASDIAKRTFDVAVVYKQDDYGSGLTNVFQENFGENVNVVPFNDTSEIPAIAQSIGSSDVSEVLFVANEEDVVAFLRAAAQNPGFENKYIFLTDTAGTQGVIDETKEATSLYERIKGTRPAPPDGAVFNTFKGAYAARYDADVTEHTYTANTYDATWLAMYASAWALLQEGAVTGKFMSYGLRRISDTNKTGTDDIAPRSWDGIVNSLRAGQDINVRGASGPLDYDTNEETWAPFEFWRFVLNDSGEYEVQPVTD